MLQDVRYAIRSLWKDGRVTAIVTACLSLGIGINATLFSVVDGVLIQPLPFTEPDSLYTLNETFERAGVRRGPVAYLLLQDWKQRLSSFSNITASTARSLAVTDGTGEEAERFAGAAIAWDLFPLVGVPPALGRPFGPDDDRLGAEPVALLSDAVWQRRYRGDPAIIGRRITINGQPHTVVGVMPPAFGFPNNEKIWIPLAPIVANDPRGARNLFFVVGRVKPGVTLDAARSEMNAVAAALAAEFPATNEGRGIAARPLEDMFIPNQVRLVLLTMMGAVTLVLLIACANVANLMLSRATVRMREFSVRAALGAGRARLVRQLLTESILLGLLAAPLGLIIAAIGVFLLRNAVPPDSIPYTVHWEMNARSIGYTAIVAALTGIIFGFAPALQAGRLNMLEALRDGSRGTGTSGRKARLRNALVVAEIALALVLLVGASLFIRSFLNLQSASPGFDWARILTLRVYMTGDQYAADQAKVSRIEDIVQRIEAVPGVEAAFASNFIPLDAGGGGARAIVEGRTVAPGEEPNISFIGVTPHYVRTVRLALVKGRDFTEAEGSRRSAVAVIDETMADRIWKGEDPIGRRFRLVDSDPNDWFTVIGVTPAIRRPNLDDTQAPVPAAFVAYPYAPTPNTGVTIRVAGDPAAITAAVRQAIRASDPGLPIFNVRTLDDVRMLLYWQFRLFGVMFGFFGAVALFLAAIGVYGVLSFAVSQRTQEIGLRMALGAERGRVLQMIVRQGLTLAALGIALGLAGAFGVTRVIRTVLYRVTPTDPVSFLAVAFFLTLIAVLASYLPARRATAVDPVVALRNE